MNTLLLSILAFIAGVLLAIPNGLSAKLGELLDGPLAAAVATFIASAIVGVLLLVAGADSIPSRSKAVDVPLYLWVVGGACSAIAIGLYYHTIPRLGLSTMICIGLSGQLVFSAIAGHFGWFDLPRESINVTRSIGLVMLLVAIVLISWKKLIQSCDALMRLREHGANSLRYGEVRKPRPTDSDI